MGGTDDAFNAAQIAILEQVATGAPLSEVLTAIVRLIEQQTEGMLCSVLLFESERGALRHGASPSLPLEYSAAIDGVAIGPCVGSCGTAAFRRERVIVEDIAHDPLWSDFKELALPHGFAACWSSPILSSTQELLGTFAMYYRTPRGPTAREISWVDKATHLAAIAIVRDHSERSLRQREERAIEVARLHAVSSSLTEAMVRARGPTELFDTACRLVVERELAVLAWIGIYDPTRDRIDPVAAFGDGAAFVDALDLRVEDPELQTAPSVRAVRSGTASVNNDLANDPELPFREAASVHGLRACAAFPLKLGDRRGVVVLYGAQPGFFREEEVHVLGRVVDDLAFVVDAEKNDAERRKLMLTLGERVKELTLLHRISRVLQAHRPFNGALLGELVSLIPQGWRYPEMCEVRIRWMGFEVTTPRWRDTQWLLAAPFRAGSEEGTIEVAYPRAPHALGSPFLPEERELIRSLADLFSSYLGRGLAETALCEREERLRLLHDLADAMRKSSDPSQVLPVALRMLGAHLGATRCAYGDVEDDQDHIVVPYEYATEGPSIVGRLRLSDFGGILENFRRGITPIAVRDVNVELPDDAAAFRAVGTRAFVVCALVREGKLRALMAVHQATPRDWKPHEVALVQEFVERCWSAIEQRAAQERLKQNEALLRIAGRAARLGAWSVDIPAGRITWSDEMFVIHDLPVGDPPTREQALSFYAPELRDGVRRTIEASVKSGIPFEIESQILTAKNRRVYVRISGTVERNAAGQVTRIQGAVQDIDERRRLEEHLRRAQKMEAVGRLAGGVAHDFNNLLSVILSYTNLMLRRIPPGDPLRGDVEEVQRAGERATDLTRQLLAFGRQQRLAPRVIDVGLAVSSMEKLLRRLIGEDVELALQLPAESAKVFVDPSQMEQIVMNLAVNARDAMPEGGTLLIDVSSIEIGSDAREANPEIRPGSYALLTVTDSGEGMDAATHEHIFEPFFTTKELGKGTGLGLSTVFGIVAQSKGHIEVESAVGQGTTFRVYLPITDQGAAGTEHSAAQDSTPMPAVARAGGTETVLLVEDDDQVRNIVRSILRRHGYRVLEAQNGGEAFLLCEAHGGRIELLVTDVVMPRMSGRELAARLAPMRPEMAVLYMSGYADGAPDGGDVLDAGIPVLRKPITPDALLTRVRDVLDARTPLPPRPVALLESAATTGALLESAETTGATSGE